MLYPAQRRRVILTGCAIATAWCAGAALRMDAVLWFYLLAIVTAMLAAAAAHRR
jgi:hypothetical protein